MISTVTPDDIQAITKIHDLYFKDEFSISDLMDPKTLRVWTVRDDKDNIICAGGVKAILEAVMVTDKSYSPEERKDAFLQILQTMLFTCREFDFNQLHAFIQDEKWLRHLKTVGFKETKGRSLVLCL